MRRLTLLSVLAIAIVCILCIFPQSALAKQDKPASAPSTSPPSAASSKPVTALSDDDDADDAALAAADHADLENYKFTEQPTSLLEEETLLDHIVVWILRNPRDFFFFLACLLVPLFGLAAFAALAMMREIKREQDEVAEEARYAAAERKKASDNSSESSKPETKKHK